MRTEEIQQAPDEEIARIAADCIAELNARVRQSRERSLSAAQASWPELERALKAAGCLIGHIVPQGHSGRPWLPEWSTEPGCYLADGPWEKPKRKAEAIAYARKYGDGGFASVSELWLWAHGGGPIIERAMREMGFGGKGESPKPHWKR